MLLNWEVGCLLGYDLLGLNALSHTKQQKRDSISNGVLTKSVVIIETWK